MHPSCAPSGQPCGPLLRPWRLRWPRMATATACSTSATTLITQVLSFEGTLGRQWFCKAPTGFKWDPHTAFQAPARATMAQQP